MSVLNDLLVIVERDLNTRAELIHNDALNSSKTILSDGIKALVCREHGVLESRDIVRMAIDWLNGNPEAQSFPSTFFNPRPLDSSPSEPIIIEADTGEAN